MRNIIIHVRMYVHACCTYECTTHTWHCPSYRYIMHRRPDSTALITPVHSHGRALLSYQPLEQDSGATLNERSLVPVSKALTIADQSVVGRHIQGGRQQSTVVGSRSSLGSLASVCSTICSCPAKEGGGIGVRNTTVMKRYVHKCHYCYFIMHIQYQSLKSYCFILVLRS